MIILHNIVECFYFMYLKLFIFISKYLLVLHTFALPYFWNERITKNFFLFISISTEKFRLTCFTISNKVV